MRAYTRRSFLDTIDCSPSIEMVILLMMSRKGLKHLTMRQEIGIDYVL